MTIRHLRIFVTVAECGNMTAASKKLYISQPAVSLAVKELETEYGICLFERLSQKLYLTDEGEQLLTRARHILALFDETEASLRARGEVSVLKIGASVTVGSCVMPKLSAEFEQAYPNADVRVTVNNTREIEKMLVHSKLDAAIVEGEVRNGDIIQIPVLPDELVLAAGRSHPMYNEKAVPLNDLKNCELIEREDGSVRRNQFEQYLTQHGITMTKKWSSSNVETIKRLTEEGRGISILSTRMIEGQLADGSMRALPVTDGDGERVFVRRQFKLIYHKDKYISSALGAFIEMCGELEKRDT